MGFIYLYRNVHVYKLHLSLFCPERALAKAGSQFQIQNGCAMGMGCGSSCGTSPLKYIPDGVQSSDFLEGDQVSIARYVWSLSTLCFLLRAYKNLYLQDREQTCHIKSNPSCDLTLPTGYNEKYYNLIYMGKSE